MNRLDRLAKGPWLGLLAAFGLFLLSRPFQGVMHDGRLYVADALGKLDPGGVGRDLLFQYDGQFGFSLYTPMLARLIHLLGLSNAAMAIVVLTLVLWFAALTALINRLLADQPPAVRWAALVFAVVLPSLYGPLDVIAFGEGYTTPRGLAEAAGLAGMATYLSGRRFLGLAVCVPGMLFHPIMGLCSAAAIAFAISVEDRRWLWAGLAGVAAVAVAGLMHLPVADRIVTVMDPAWRAVVEARSPILFPSLWPVEAWGRLTVHACTAAAAACVLKNAPRRLVLGALIAGLAGVAVVALLGDRLSLVLFLQVQSWRMLQPMAVLSVAGLALLSVELPRRGPSGLLGLAFLAVAWMLRDIGGLGLLVAPVGLLFVLVGDGVNFTRPRLFSGLAVGLLIVAVLGYGALRSYALARGLAHMPSVRAFSLGLVWNSCLPALVISLTLGVWLARGWSPPPVAVRVALVAVIGLLAALLWDDRSAYVKARDRGANAALQTLIASRPGEVLWLAGDVEPWVLAGRASWASKMQGAGVVFSRPLALLIQDRVERLERIGLVGHDWLRPLTADASQPARPTVEKVRRFCAASDAPAWIVWPYTDDTPLEPALQARDWRPPAPYVLELTKMFGSGWLTADRYAVIPCVGG